MPVCSASASSTGIELGSRQRDAIRPAGDLLRFDGEYLFYLTAEELQQLNEQLSAGLYEQMHERLADPSKRPAGSLPVEMLLFSYPISFPADETTPANPAQRRARVVTDAIEADAPADGSAGTAEPVSVPVPLRRNAGFRMLWIGQVLSDTGTSAALIAYPLLILALTHSAALAGVVGTVRLVVQLVLGPARRGAGGPVRPAAHDDHL